VPGRKAQEHLKFDYTPGYIHPDAVDIEFQARAEGLRRRRADRQGRVGAHAYDGVMFDDRHRKNTFASSTMVTDGERAYAFFESAGSTPTTSKARSRGRRTSAASSRPASGPARRRSSTRT
jgi:hypothetical protein